MTKTDESDDTPKVPSHLNGITVVLAGSHPADRLLSMERYAKLLRAGLADRGVQVVLATPQACLENLPGLPASAAKIARYLDKYVLFPLRLRWQLRHAGPMIVHVTDQGNGLYLPWLRGFNLVVTSHDLLAIRAALGEFPQEQRRASKGWGQRAIQKSLRLANTVVCDSKKTLADGQRLLDPVRQRFWVVSIPVDRHYFCEIPPARPSDLPEKYILHVGSSTWYKNRAAVLRIHAAMREQNPGSPPLVLIGDRLSERESRVADELGLTGHLILRERPPDEYVTAAYASAECLVFPSLEEGFGWPVLEAMATGCPVFTSNRPPLTEVGGTAAEYIDPEDPKAAAALILKCLAQGAEWHRAKAEEGRQWAATFTSERFIDGMLEVYAATLDGRSNKIA